MSTVLQHIAEGYSLRLKAQSAMLAHLDVDPGPDLALALQPELLGTLRACARCTDPEGCLAHIRTGRDGLPGGCRAVLAFAALSYALKQERGRSAAA